MSIMNGVLMILSQFQRILCQENQVLPKVKFIYFEKATKFGKIFTLVLTVCEGKVKISHNYVAFSEYMNFNKKCAPKLVFPVLP